MEPQTKTSAKDFFINLGAIVALGVVVFNLVSLLFTVINRAYPQTTNYGYFGSDTISFPVASLIIFFPIYILLMWLLERVYRVEPEKRKLGVRKWLTYITLFLAGLTVAIDLVTVLYYFLDGRDLTTGFILKAFSVLVIAAGIFFYYIRDVMEKQNSSSRKIWTIVSAVIILASVAWGFSVLGSPRAQQLIKYDEQKMNDLQNINYQIENYYQTNGGSPGALSDLNDRNYGTIPLDNQTGKPYEYTLIGQSAKAYSLCAVFNTDSKAQASNGYSYPVGTSFGAHPAGHYCYTLTIPVSQYKDVPPIKYPPPAPVSQ